MLRSIPSSLQLFPFLGALFLPGIPAAQDVTSPEAHLGRPVGADFELADWSEVTGYFKTLDQESERVNVEVVGTTTEGRDFLLATISSEANLARLETLRAAARRIADPRGMTPEERVSVLETAKPILFISIAMHSTETAAPQFGMEFAHRLATSDEEPYRTAREELVCLVAPCLNPDGLDHVVSWYRETVGTPYEASGLLELYQLYAGHDNNRDWFMLSQNETRIVTRLLYSEWTPQVYWDVHQQGSSRERFFVPPFRDPLNPNLDAGVITAIGQLGTRALFDMTRAGYKGVSTGVTYDMWWNGGNRNVPVRHNIAGLLTEAASVRIATPVFLPKSELSGPRGLGDYAPSNQFPDPWPGGWWRLRDIIDYEHAFARSLLGSISREPKLWLENALDAAERAVAKGKLDSPKAWILPTTNTDLGALRRLLDALQLGGVELSAAEQDFEADGRTWPAGSVVIRRDQPYGQHVKDLFEVQRYPEGAPPYDVAGWTLPMLLGVRRVEVVEELDLATRPIETLPRFQPGLDLRGDANDSDTWRDVIGNLARGSGVSFSRTEDPPHLEFRPTGIDETWSRLDSLPRVGLYAPWRGAMNEGWTRWVFDTYELPYVRVRNEMIRAGRLDEFLDVLVLSGVSGNQLDEGRELGTIPPEYARGLGPEGAAAVEDFVRRGGRLIAVERSAGWAVELFDLPLVDVTRGEQAGDFSCPGSVVRSVPETGAEALEWTAGLPTSLPVFFSSSLAWRPETDEDREEGDAKKGEPEDERRMEVLLRYAPTRTLLSGWIRSPEVIAGRAAWVRAEHGRGRVHLFGFRPQYRSWSQASFQLLFRAILFDG